MVAKRVVELMAETLRRNLALIFLLKASGLSTPTLESREAENAQSWLRMMRPSKGRSENKFQILVLSHEYRV